MDEYNDYDDEDFDPIPDWVRDDAEQEWAARWIDAWDRLEALGIVSSPEDNNLPLSELERLCDYIKE